MCPNLAEIRLSGSRLSSIKFQRTVYSDDLLLDTTIDFLCKGSPNLKKLCITEADLLESPPHVTDAAVHSIVLNCPYIEVLSLADWTGVTDQSIAGLTGLRCLQEIDLSNCTKLASAAVQELIKANRSLEAITLSDFYLYKGGLATVISNALLRCIGHHCPNLIKLQLNMYTTADDSDATAASFEAMIKGLPSLVDLHICDYDKPKTILPTLGMYCKSLKCIFFNSVQCTDDDLISMCQGCPLIESIRLYLNSITDISIYALASSCPMLKELNITLVHITDQSLRTLFATCTQLTSVALSGLPHITDKSILTLLRYCTHLTSLSVIANLGLTDYRIQAIPTYCPLLQRLSLDHIPTLSHETIIQISKYCTYIQTLGLLNCIQINNDTVVTILKNCKNLININISSDSLYINDVFKHQCNELTSKRKYRNLRLTYYKTSLRSA